MFDFIEKIRSKSDTEKRRIALGASAGLTLVIFIVWFFVVVNNISSLSNSADTSTPDTPSPFAQMGESFSQVFDRMSDIFNQASAVVPQTESSTTEAQQ